MIITAILFVLTVIIVGEKLHAKPSFYVITCLAVLFFGVTIGAMVLLVLTLLCMD